MENKEKIIELLESASEAQVGEIYYFVEAYLGDAEKLN